MTVQQIDNTANTYAKLFPEQLANTCNPDAPEANCGPVAYLHALYQEALAQEASSTSTARRTLAQRRPDIGELMLDPKSLEQPVTALTLAIRSLARTAQAHAGSDAHLPQVLAEAGQHANLPFHAAQEQIKAILKHRKIPHFELLQQAEYTYPSFRHGQLRTQELRKVMRNATGFSPALQALLLAEKPLRSTGNEWRAWYGYDNSTDAKKAIEALLDVETYCQRTGLTTEQVLEMIAVSSIDDNAKSGFSSVRRSDAYPITTHAVDKYHPGAAYINARRKTALTVKDGLESPGIALKFDALDYDCLSRMYQMIHLQRALALPFADVDLLLMSILRAEGQIGNWHLTPATLRALGVFQYLKDTYDVSAEQFAALVLEVSAYSVGERTPMLDRVLDGQGTTQGQRSLVIDGRAFDPADRGDGQYKVLPALSSALGVTEPVTLGYLKMACKALNLKSPTLSLALLSSLYRLSRLHRLLKRTPNDAMALLALLGSTGTTLQDQLAGTPQISDLNAPDVLDMLVALVNLDQWLRQERIQPTTLLLALTPTGEAKPTQDSRLGQVIGDHLQAIDQAFSDKSNSKLEDLAATMLGLALADASGRQEVTKLHVAPLLKWCGTTAEGLLKNIHEAAKGKDPKQLGAILEKLTGALWSKVMRCGELIKALRLTPGMVDAPGNHGAWFDLESTPATGITLNLDLCYQLSRFRAWVIVCQQHKHDEQDVIGYLTNHPYSLEPGKVTEASKRLAELIGWTAQETLEASPHIEKATYAGNTRATFDDYLASLTPAEKSKYEEMGEESFFCEFIYRYTASYAFKGAHQSMVDKLVAFLAENPEPLLLSPEQYEKAHKPELWKAKGEEYKSDVKRGYFPITLDALDGGKVRSVEWLPCVPTTVSDIDFILRVQALSARTGLSSGSLLDLAELDEASPYIEFEAISQLFLAASGDATRETVEAHAQESWRDALAGYLIAHWAPAQDNTRSISSIDDLSDYCLCDAFVGSQVNTTPLNQAIGSLQHYVSRLLARLEPGYADATPSGTLQAQWQQGLGQYGTWKRLVEQRNHPANLIYYADRPNKTVAFQELEVEINQGKMDTSLLDTAICNYLTKFERVSNLQVISGYLDGHDPKHDTYHLIAKTNTTPYQYYWRTLDLNLRDDKDRISPLAWSEWEKVDLSPSGEIAQSVNDGKCFDAVRPVVIAKRHYVFWVERASSDLPKEKDASKTLHGKRRLSVHYAFRQSDGTWSTSNELLCLDGYDDKGNWDEKIYAKSLDFKPGLIVVVNDEGERENDPWLTALLYDSSVDYSKRYETTEGKTAQKPTTDDYHLESRDLLLIERKEYDPNVKKELVEALFRSYKNAQTVQHPYNGTSVVIERNEKSHEETPPGLGDKAGFAAIAKEQAFTLHLAVSSARKKELTASVLYNKERFLDGSWGNNFKLEISVKNGNSTHSASDHLSVNHKHLAARVKFLYTPDTEYEITLKYQHGSTLLNKSVYTVTVKDLKVDELWSVCLASNTAQAQYLDLSLAKVFQPRLTNDKIRLNTLFGKNLVARASQSIHRVLDWDTQTLLEPDLDDATKTIEMDFHGANALYFRELFLHVPAMIAMRLTEQCQFEEAEDWYLRYLFNPYRIHADEQGRPAPWCTRPLSQVGTLRSALRKRVEPIDQVFIQSRHYQQAIYLALLDNWQQQGDHYYRQPTLSNLNHAWMCYQQALKLLGPLPNQGDASRWKPATLATVSASAFRSPLNPRILALRKTLLSRLHNLRHGLTLDGKALPPLDWNSESLDAFDNDRGGVSNVPIPYRSGLNAIPHYRFRQLLPLAKAAAQQLSDFGRHYMSLMEEEFNTSLAVQLKAQDIKMADFAIRLQKEAISGVEAKKKVLLISRDKALAQKEYFGELIDVGRSPEEELATAFSWMSKASKAAAIYNFAIAGALGVTVPTIYGLAVGGNKPEAMNVWLGQGFEMAADISNVIADELVIQAAYNRRAAGWAFDKSQAEWDLKIIDQQLAETNIELNASTINLEKCRQDLVNLKEAYVSMTTGFTIIPIYNWLVARQEHIYGAAYDAVRSLCMGVEAAWRYEIGDYRRDSFIDTRAWRDNYKGMLVGESLLVNLQQMENEYLARNERRLTIKKSFSLKKQLDSFAIKPEEKWAGIFKTEADRTTSLKHTFEFKADDFDKGYPGHYLRQLKYVSVTLVLKADKKPEELCAILKQTGSSTLLEPDKGAARSFYPGNESDKKVTDARENPRLVQRNPRENQQIALSSTVAEDGLGYDAGTWVYELMFHDGRYLPFEGTGAISQWTLELLGDEDLLKDLSIIEDIRFNMVYTAKTGDEAFIKEIGEIRKEAGSVKQGDA
ncbi:Tc toxin subunit A-related protein [Pseudomonas mosselii]|uniref:Tc toxin subunit A-related protein n=1 Tax=Pseudomonas mosselii TaxID=78327 RepID=UPI000D9E0031|nr:neuraminidase-like domain-containing protein [Pseudomonas mosselii]PYC27036.1 hypothetical protein DMX06_04485 [Pseudomonas mosselii]